MATSALLTYFSTLQTVGEYFYISQRLNWAEAQTYCRTYYTELSFVYNQDQNEKLLGVAGRSGWIGLYKDPQNSSLWNWSGGGPMTFQNWSIGQPDNFNHSETKVSIWFNGFWNDVNEAVQMPFSCVSLKLSWEQALEYCRVTDRNLGSISSEDEFLQVKKFKDSVDQMWVNLRYLGDSWLWADGKTSKLAWSSEGSVEQCPVKNRCAVLNSDGLLESWDCQDELYFICK